MEDRDKSKATKSDSIVDLTPEMEVSDASQIDIIDLTDVVDGPDDIPPAASPVEEPPTETEPPAAPSSPRSTVSSAIEQEVEAAFDFVQSPIMETPPVEEPPVDHEGLMDKLSDIPGLVDDALDASGEPEDTRAVDAAEPDASDDEIIELTDIVDPAELDAAGLNMGRDDEIIDLNDIVDPSELEAAGLRMDEDDDIIELTDIVDPSELRVGAVATEPEVTADARPAASDAPAGQTAEAGLDNQEYEDLLDMIDTLDADDLLVDLAEEEARALESASDEPEVGEPEAAATDAGPEPEETPDEDSEYANLLETIDSLDPEDLLVSVDEAGLLDSGEDADAAAGDNGEMVTLTDVLNRNADETAERPPVERVGGVIREVEEETGRDVRSLTDQEVEAAVERILKTKYAETIERLIANAVEKAVSREIENLKRTMLDDD